MANYFRNLMSYFMSDKCYNEFFVNFNIYDVDCLKQTISKGLGVGIILGSALVKLPQILKLYNAKSAEGISFIGVLLELMAVTSSASYSYSKAYPFSSWGESLFLMLETTVIGFLVLLYSSKRRNANAFAGAYSVIVYMLFAGIVPSSVLWSMQVANVPITVTGKVRRSAADAGEPGGEGERPHRHQEAGRRGGGVALQGRKVLLQAAPRTAGQVPQVNGW